ncbi:Rpn family recombination-promoting nuclease/putative transposase [Anabaena azotica]|uniref:Rpn family recombination-promoting nuclease/putative transposase n=1 Tax=Anabaena azotica TaxID=197653 RepID=UPI0039A52652
MTESIDHDRLFKELISTFFIEFIDLFFPEVINYIDPASVTLLDKEIFTDITAGDKYEADLIAQVKFREEPSFFLIHIEAESTSRSRFDKRMFRYFARLHEKFDLPIYPIVIFSYDSPKKIASSNYQINFPDFEVLKFNYRVIQLNQLNWRDFLNRDNPVASALMSKMNIVPTDRPKVKAECLRLLVTLKLNPAKMQLISGFIDTYLKLNQSEEQIFQTKLGSFKQEEQEKVMQIVTSWMQQGIEQGIDQGIQREKDLIVRLIKRKLGTIDPKLEADVRGLGIESIEVLGEALLDFSTEEDLRNWLNNFNN